MQKTKIDMSKYADMCEEEVVNGKDGTTVRVRTHISYSDKEQMAREIAESVLIVHDDSCMYESDAYDAVEKYMIAKYYTDIDTDEAAIFDVADFMVNNEIIGNVAAVIWSDFENVLDIYERIKDATIKTYEDDKSLAKAIRTSFGFLLNGEDITESIAKAENTNNTLISAIEALRGAEKEKSENVSNGKMTVGGNIINFAKKE